MENAKPPIGTYDAFRDVESWSTEQAQYWIDALNRRALAPDQMAIRGRLLEQCALQPGAAILELGCGTGRLLAELAEAAGPSGRVTGLEPQPVLAQEAERFIRERQFSANTRIITARAEKIPLHDASLDLCVAQTVLVHIPADALVSVFAEVKRVLKPGGRFISVDQDGDTWIIDHPQRAVTRRVMQFNSDYRYADGWRGRDLRRLFIQNGFEDIRVQAWPHLDTEPGSYLHTMALRIAQSAAEHGAISQDECGGWLAELEKITEAGSFFSSICFYCCQGKKPAA